MTRVISPASIACVAMAFAQPLAAMQLVVDPPFLHLSGHVDSGDWAQWEQTMERYGARIDTVVFHNSPGGDSITGRRIGHAIRERVFEPWSPGIACQPARTCSSAGT